MFELKTITKQYGQTTVLHETTLTVNDGEFFCSRRCQRKR